MKNILYSIISLLVFFLALFVYTKLAGPIPFSITNVTTNKASGFTITGEGKVAIAPDIATTMVGVEANGATVKEAQDELNQNINAVSAAIKKLGIGDKDIETSNYNVNPTYDYSSNTQRITGYQAGSSLTIKVRDIAKVNSVIDAATTAGANVVGGVSFDVDDKTKAQNDARKLAVADAKAKAEQASQTAGFSLGKLIDYQESFGNDRIYPMYATMDIAAKGEGAPTQIESGATDIRVTVTLTYEVK